MSLTLLLAAALGVPFPPAIPDPTLDDAVRLPPSDVISAWQLPIERALGWTQYFAAQPKMPFMGRMYFSCYSKELLQTFTMLRHMENVRDERVDRKLRFEGLRWLRDHYPESWKTRKWPVAELLRGFPESEPNQWCPDPYPRIPDEARVPRMRSDGESLPAPARKQAIDD
jgi:hypothetical protein